MPIGQTTLAWAPERMAISHRYKTIRSPDGSAMNYHATQWPGSRGSQRIFSVSSSFASEADKTELERVFGVCTGGAASFGWTPPDEGSPVECRFLSSTLSIEQRSGAKLYSVQVEIEEM